MILTNAPVNEAIVSNVSEIGEFRIRNSAKAFSILSSGLYANKIRAIVRELSCNAVDSHAAAGKHNVPFDVHLPNQLEPHFSIRDYGVGLSHEQVTQIYTTYFESTKTGSNEFIGALGLGSKSPFSYTDNFTVTAIKDGKRGIYSAFINEHGVPSIALMMQEETNEPSGVEVKFSVNDYADYSKFRNEAQTVYTHFSLRPVVNGCTGFEFTNIAYERKDIIPGIHSIANHRRCSVAVMGNIAYPIDVPQSATVMGELNNLLACGLEMHFDIGELDFQASREGLSYIPQTISAIKCKLELLNNSLAEVLKLEADAIPNLWERAVFLQKRRQHSLWSAAAVKYATDTKLVTYINDNQPALARWMLKVDDLANDYNIVLKGIQRNRHSKGITPMKASLEYAPGHAKNPAGNFITWLAWTVGVDADSHFVVNDLKTGALERTKHHYREEGSYHRNVFIIEAADKTQSIKTNEFFAMLHNPPEDRIFKASSLTEKSRNNTGSRIAKNVTIMALERRGGSGYRRSDHNMVWRASDNIESFDKNTKFYYVPLSGFVIESTKGYQDGKELHDDITSMPGLFSGTIYGVRKGDIEEVKTRKNWINLEEHIESAITIMNTKCLLSVVKSKLDSDNIFNYNNEVVNNVNPASPFAQLVNVFKDVSKFSGNSFNLENLFRKFAPTVNFNPDLLVTKYQAEIDKIKSRYPLLKEIGTYRTDAGDIAEYINLIDTKKGI
jgi:hypothetical protein